MPDIKTQPRFKVGDKVRARFGTRLVGTVMEVQGIRRILYSVYVPMEPEPLKLLVREDEIEKV
jgi:hypothetical protein